MLYAKFKGFEEAELKIKNNLNHELNIIRKENHEKYMCKKENELNDHNILHRRIDNTDKRQVILLNTTLI